MLPRHSRRLPWSGAPPFPDSVESECGLFVDNVDLLASPGCLAGFFSHQPHTLPGPVRLPKPGAAFGQAAASCPAPARSLLARPGPASHSWAHQFPPHHSTVRAAPAASSDLPARGGIRPSCGELPSASQEPVGSSQASFALMGTSGPPTPHHSACCARGEQRPAEPGRAWPRAEEKKETGLQHAVGVRTGIGPVAVFLIPLVIETTPYRTDTSYSIFAPPNSRVPARAGHAEPLQLLRARYRPKATSHWYRNVLEKTRGRFVR